MSEATDAYLAHLGIEVDDEIKHYGKKGMKWGFRKDDRGSSAAGSADKSAKPKVTSGDIKAARERQRRRELEVDIQRNRVTSAKGFKEAKAILAKYKEMKADQLTNPDAALAKKMTTGEKIATGVNATLIVAGTAYTISRKNEFLNQALKELVS